MAGNSYLGSASLTIGGRTYTSGTVASQVQSKATVINKPFMRVSTSAPSPKTSQTYQSSYITIRSPMLNTSLLKAGGRTAVDKVKNAFDRNNDMGNQMAKSIVVSGVSSYLYFKGVKAVTPVTAQVIKNMPSAVRKTSKTIVKAGKGVYEIYTAADKLVVTIKNSLPYMKNGFIPFKTAFRSNVILSGLNRTAVSGRIINAAAKIKNNSVTIKKAITNPSVFKQKAVAFSKRTATKTVRGVGSATKWTVNKGIPGAVRGTYKLSVGVTGMLATSNEEMVRTAGQAGMITHYSIKTAIASEKLAGRTIKTSVKAGYKTANTIYNTINYARNNGFKATLSKAKDKIVSTVAKAGGSAVSAIINSIKGLGSKIVMPLIIGVAAIVVVIALLGGGAGTIAYYLSGEFLFDNGDGTYTLTDIKTFLYDEIYGIPVERYKEVKYVYNLTQSQLKTSLDIFGNPGEFDKVKFKIELDDYAMNVTDKETALDTIDLFFYTNDEMYEVIQPVFYAALLAEHDLEPSEEEAIETFQEICNIIFSHDREIVTEQCDMSVHSCGLKHTLANCPNPVSVVHTEYTCSNCCHYRCDGHKTEVCPLRSTTGHICTTDCKKVLTNTYCDGCIFVCDGETYCNGHVVAIYTWNMEDVDYFLEEYFIEPIQELEEEDERTPEEEQQLSLLKDYYALCLAYLEK